MSEKEKKEIAEIVETAKHLAVHDPQAFVIAKKQHGDSKDQSGYGQAGKRTGIENATSTNSDA